MVQKLQQENKYKLNLILINPATSYYKSDWPRKIKEWQENKDKLKHSVLFDLIGHGPSLIDIFQNITYLKNRFPNESNYHTLMYIYTLINFFNISFDYVEHRVMEWLEDGLKEVSKHYTEISCKTILIAGDNDTFLPSREEILHLDGIMKDTIVVHVPNNAHMISIRNCDISQLILKHFK